MANPRIEVEIGAKINEFERKFNEVDKQLDNTGKQFNKLNEFATGALQGIAAAFTVGAVVNFGKAVLDTTAKFQKFEAVLRNTLGSGSAAQIALIQISKFASETPFQVDELTSAFIKLANQGFRPTVSQLRSLGDLAASTGKSFDQLAEAIIDAQVGEFERLKEFGIRAKKEGDNVTFTFKGVETQVKNTNEAIRGYILSLGNAEGVSGAMSKISETLGGKISNLEDNIEALRLAIGNQTSGVFAASLDWLNSFVEATTRATKSIATLREEASFSQVTTQIEANRKAVIGLAEDYQSLDPNLTKQEAFRKAISFLSKDFKDAKTNLEAFRKTNYTNSELNQIIQGFEDLFNEFVIGSPVVDESTQSFEEFSKAFDKVNNNIRTFSTQPLVDAYFEAIRIGSEFEKSLLRAASGLTGKEGETRKDPKFVDVPLPPEEQFTETAKKIKTFADFYKEVQEETDQTTQLLIDSFANLGAQVASSLNISNDALRGFVGTLLSNTPKIIQAIFQTAAANKLASEANIASSKKGALANGIFMATETGKTLGPVGLALLPILIGGVVALISGAFRKTGSGGSSVGTSGLGAGTSFTSGATGFGFAQNREIRGELVARGQDLVYVFNEANTRINKG